MPHLSRVFVTAAIVAASLPTRAHACSGPCTSPELWGLVPLDETPLVITNFGLLRPLEDGWQLTCEEVIGGILLAVESNDVEAVVSTDVGLFVADKDVCGFSPGPTSDRSSWFLDFAIAADSTPTNPHVLGLVSDATASVVNVELAQGNTFEVLHALGSQTAYRKVEASADFSSIVVAGYASQPRRWQLAWSTDSGNSWQEFTPEVVSSSASALLMGLDPSDDDRVFFQIQATDETPAELWSFERTTETATQLLVLEAGHAVTGLAFVGDEVWLSSKSSGGGGLYRAGLPDVAEFEAVIDDVPPLACLGLVGGEPYVCVEDYSIDSPFLLGKVNVETSGFEPLMRIGDLGKLKDCGAACARTHEWLDSVYGDGSSAGSDTNSNSSDVDGTGDTSTPSEPPPASTEDGGCAVLPPRPSSSLRPADSTAMLVLGLLGLTARARRRRVVA